MKVELHVHTSYSDGDAIDKILCYARKRRLDAIAITDHDYGLGGGGRGN